MVEFGNANAGISLQAKVVPPGASILLPREAATLANGPWQSAAEVSVRIVEEGHSIRGIVPLKGLSAAVQVLAANCPG
jgi:hypothetical protein